MTDAYGREFVPALGTVQERLAIIIERLTPVTEVMVPIVDLGNWKNEDDW